MRNSILFASSLLLCTTALADQNRFYTTSDGAGYEARLREFGIPQSGGMVWPVMNIPAPRAVLAPPATGIAPAAAQTAPGRPEASAAERRSHAG
ncbi:MAG: hypothetical protein JNJ60_11940 [Rhodocyclaceae bacterium]|nr:hypothetical protein [Rhodocyclaceae bacterium]